MKASDLGQGVGSMFVNMGVGFCLSLCEHLTHLVLQKV